MGTGNVLNLLQPSVKPIYPLLSHLGHEMRVAVGGHHGVVGALALAEVCLVLLGVDDPVPTVVLLEVDCVVPQAAVRLVHVVLLCANLGG